MQCEWVPRVQSHKPCAAALRGTQTSLRWDASGAAEAFRCFCAVNYRTHCRKIYNSWHWLHSRLWTTAGCIGNYGQNLSRFNA